MSRMAWAPRSPLGVLVLLLLSKAGTFEGFRTENLDLRGRALQEMPAGDPGQVTIVRDVGR